MAAESGGGIMQTFCKVLPPSGLTTLTAAQFTVYAALLNLGALVGAFAGSSLMDRIGRRKALGASAALHAAGWVAGGLATGPALLLPSRALLGVAVGMGSSVSLCYLGEIATPRLRSSLGLVNQLSLTAGMLLANVAGNYSCLAVEAGGLGRNSVKGHSEVVDCGRLRAARGPGMGSSGNGALRNGGAPRLTLHGPWGVVLLLRCTLALHGHCAGDTSALEWHCTGPVVGPFWYSFRTTLAQYSCCTAATLVPHWSEY